MGHYPRLLSKPGQSLRPVGISLEIPFIAPTLRLAKRRRVINVYWEKFSKRTCSGTSL